MLQCVAVRGSVFHVVYRMLQCVAVCCSVLQCAAVRCSALQCVAVCCSVLQCVAVCCSALQCVAVRCTTLQHVAVVVAVPVTWNKRWQEFRFTRKPSERGVPLFLAHCSISRCRGSCAACCSELQCVAVCCSVLQCAAVCCSVLQCAAVCCSV